MAGGLNRNITVRLLADTSNFTAGMAKVSAEAEKTSTTMEATGGKTKLLTTGIAAAGIAATALGIAAVRMAADFDAGMSTVQANTGASADEMSLLRQAAIDAGADTVYSATDAADAINELGKAGMSTSDILSGGLNGALDLAASDGMEVAEAAELMSSAMAQFNLTGADATRIADALAAGAGKAQGSARDLGYALQQSGMVANSFGIGMEETVGTLTSFANAGMTGSDAGTSLKSMLLALANPTKKAQNLMDELGISAYDAQGNFIGLKALAGQLQTQMSGLTQAQRNQALATIFGSDAIRAANVLYNEGADGIADWTKKVSDSGYAAQQAAAKNDNLRGDLENLSGSFESMMIKLGEGGQGPLRKLVQTIDMLVDGFGQLPAPVQQTIVLSTALAGGIVALHRAMAPLNSSSSQLSKNLGMVLDPGQRLISMGSQLYTGATQIGAAFSTQSRQLEVFGSTVSRTSGVMTGLKTMGSGVIDLLGGPWGIAITAAGLALFDFAQDQQAAAQRVDELTQALQSGQTAAEYFGKALSDSSSSRYTDDFLSRWASGYDDIAEAIDRMGISHQTYIKAIQGDKDAIEQVHAQADEYAASLNLIDQWWNNPSSAAYEALAEQQNVFKQATKDAAEAEKAATEASMGRTAALITGNDALAGTADASAKAADSDTILQESFGATKDAVNETSAALGEVIDALNTYYGFALDASNASIALESSFDKASEAVGKNGRTLDINTEKGRDNTSALNDVAEAAQKAMLAHAKNGEGLEQITPIVQRARDQYIQLAQQMGMSKEEAEASADAYGLNTDKLRDLIVQSSIASGQTGDLQAAFDRLGLSTSDVKLKVDNMVGSMRLIPAEKTTTVRVNDLASNAIHTIREGIELLQSKTVTIRTNVITNETTIQHEGLDDRPSHLLHGRLLRRQRLRDARLLRRRHRGGAAARHSAPVGAGGQHHARQREAAQRRVRQQRQKRPILRCRHVCGHEPPPASEGDVHGRRGTAGALGGGHLPGRDGRAGTHLGHPRVRRPHRRGAARPRDGQGTGTKERNGTVSVFQRMPADPLMHILLDGRPLDWYGLSATDGVLAIEAPDLAVAYQSAPGMAGSHDVTLDDPLGCAYPGLRRIALGVVTVGEDDEMMDARRRLGSLIGRLATLSYRELPGQWRGRVTIKDWDERMLGPCRVDCATTIVMDAYPHIMGRAQRHTLREGANLLHVTGNRPAWPVLTLTTSRAVSALSIKDGRGHTIDIRPAATLPAGTSVLVDCKAQTTRANGTLAPVSLDTDYFALLPGMNTLTLSGAAGSCEHEPEWMI